MFVILLYAVHTEDIQCDITMYPTSSSRTRVDIQASVRAHKDILNYLLQAHALTGCDTVSSFHGIGKSTMITMLDSGKYVRDLGSPDISMESIIS